MIMGIYCSSIAQYKNIDNLFVESVSGGIKLKVGSGTKIN